MNGIWHKYCTKYTVNDFYVEFIAMAKSNELIFEAANNKSVSYWNIFLLKYISYKYVLNIKMKMMYVLNIKMNTIALD